MEEILIEIFGLGSLKFKGSFYVQQWRTGGVCVCVCLNTPPRNSGVLTKLSRIPSSVENTSVTT